MEKKIIIRDTRNGEWFWVNNLVLKHPYLTKQAKLVYCALTSFSGHNGQKVYPSITTLCKLASVRRSTAIKAIKQLEKYRFIETEKIDGKVTKYILLKLVDDKPIKSSAKGLRHQSKRATGVVQKGYSNKTYKQDLSNKKDSSKKLKPFFRGEQMRRFKGKWWVLPANGDQWLEFAGRLSEISWK